MPRVLFSAALLLASIAQAQNSNCEKLLQSQSVLQVIPRLMDQLDRKQTLALRGELPELTDESLERLRAIREEARRFSVQYRLERIQAHQSTLRIDLELTGISKNLAQALLALNDSLNIGLIRNWEVRSLEPVRVPPPVPILSPNPPGATSNIFFRNLMKTRLDWLNFSVRTANALKNNNLVFLGDVVPKTDGELIRLAHVGRKSVNEIKGLYSALGLEPGMDVPGWPYEDLKLEDTEGFKLHYEISEWIEQTELELRRTLNLLNYTEAPIILTIQGRPALAVLSLDTLLRNARTLLGLIGPQLNHEDNLNLWHEHWAKWQIHWQNFQTLPLNAVTGELAYRELSAFSQQLEPAVVKYGDERKQVFVILPLGRLKYSGD